MEKRKSVRRISNYSTLTPTQSQNEKDPRSSLKKIDSDSNYYIKLGFTPARINFLKKIFEGFDVNGDGFLTPKELRDAIYSLGLKLKQKEIYRLIAQFDYNGDGTIGYKEFLDMMLLPEHSNQALKQVQMAAKSLAENKTYNFEIKSGPILATEEDYDKAIASIPKDKLPKYEMVFRVLDGDGGGSINPKEFESSLTSLQHSVSKYDVYEMLSEIDTDGDGSLSIREFLRTMAIKDGSGSHLVRSLRVIVKEIIEGKRVLHRPTHTKRYKRRWNDIGNLIIVHGISESDFKEISDFFDLLDLEAKEEINVKYILSKVKNIEPKLNEEEKKLWSLIATSTHDPIKFEEFLDLYGMNQVDVKTLLGLKQTLAPLLPQKFDFSQDGLAHDSDEDKSNEQKDKEKSILHDDDSKQLNEQKMKILQRKQSKIDNQIIELLQEKARLLQELQVRDATVNCLQEEVNNKDEKLKRIEALSTESTQVINQTLQKLTDDVKYLKDQNQRLEIENKQHEKENQALMEKMKLDKEALETDLKEKERQSYLKTKEHESIIQCLKEQLEDKTLDLERQAKNFETYKQKLLAENQMNSNELFEKELEDKNQKISGLEKKIKELNKAMSDKIADFDDELKKLHEDHSKLKTGYEEKLLQKDTKYLLLDQLKNQLDEDVKKLEKKVNLDEGMITQMNTKLQEQIENQNHLQRKHDEMVRRLERDIEGCHSHIKDLEDELATKDKSIEKLNVNMQHLIEKNNKDMEEQEEKNQALNKENEDLKRAMKKLESELNDKKTELEREKSSLAQYNEHYSAENNAQEETIQRLRKDSMGFMTKLRNLEHAVAEKTLANESLNSTLEKQLEANRIQKQKYEEKLLQLNLDADDMKAKIKNLENELEKGTNAYGRLDNELKEMSENHKKELQKRDDKLKESASTNELLQARINSLESEGQKKDEKIQKLNESLEGYKQENEKVKEDLEALIKKLQKTIEELQARIKALENELAIKDEKIAKLLQELQAQNEHHAKEMENVLATNRNYIKQHDEDIQKINDLTIRLDNKTEFGLRLEAMNKEQAEKYNKELANRIENEKRLEFQIEELLLKQKENELESLNKNKLIDELKIKIDEILASYKGEIENKDDIIRGLRKDKEELMLKINDMEGILANKIQEYDFLLTSKKTSDDHDYLETRRKELEDQNNDLLNTKRRLIVDLKDKDNMISDLQNELLMKNKRINMLEESLKDKDLAMDNTILVNELRNKIIDLQKEVTTIATDTTKKNIETIQSFNTEKSVWQQEKDELIKAIGQYQKQIQELMSKSHVDHGSSSGGGHGGDAAIGEQISTESNIQPEGHIRLRIEESKKKNAPKQAHARGSDHHIVNPDEQQEELGNLNQREEEEEVKDGVIDLNKPINKAIMTNDGLITLDGNLGVDSKTQNLDTQAQRSRLANNEKDHIKNKAIRLSRSPRGGDTSNEGITTKMMDADIQTETLSVEAKDPTEVKSKRKVSWQENLAEVIPDNTKQHGNDDDDDMENRRHGYSLKSKIASALVSIVVRHSKNDDN